MRYRLRTLLILMAIGPPIMAAVIPPLLDLLHPKAPITIKIGPSSVASQLTIEVLP